jgi:hypothetical protein
MEMYTGSSCSNFDQRMIRKSRPRFSEKDHAPTKDTRKSPAAFRPPGSPKSIRVARLDHAENDCADEGKGEIRRQYAQPVDESHGKAPLGLRHCPH